MGAKIVQAERNAKFIWKKGTRQGAEIYFQTPCRTPFSKRSLGHCLGAAYLNQAASIAAQVKIGHNGPQAQPFQREQKRSLDYCASIAAQVKITQVKIAHLKF
ncbi:MAG: hypothetical protein IIX78_00855, partial [Alistipes sp.]|nr:hypothetical protein [Alistipes sp.]